jgi:hypothetical protein
LSDKQGFGNCRRKEAREFPAIEFTIAIERIAEFLVPVAHAARQKISFTKDWKPRGHWILR